MVPCRHVLVQRIQVGLAARPTTAPQACWSEGVEWEVGGVRGWSGRSEGVEWEVGGVREWRWEVGGVREWSGTSEADNLCTILACFGFATEPPPIYSS